MEIGSSTAAKRLRLFTAVVAGLIAAATARADDAVLLYRATWGGLPAAHIRVVAHATADAYHVEMQIASEGLPQLVTHFRATAIVDGRLTTGKSPVPAHFSANYDLRKKKNGKLRMSFVTHGTAIVAERDADDDSHTKLLGEEFRRNVIDPLSAIVAIEAAVRRGDTAFTVPVYDGTRRFDIVGRALAHNPAEPGIHLAITLVAIAGFKGGHEGDPDDAPRPMSLTLSNDTRQQPLLMSVPIWFLPLDVVLVRSCAPNAPCRW